jgi:hypothetical protein
MCKIFWGTLPAYSRLPDGAVKEAQSICSASWDPSRPSVLEEALLETVDKVSSKAAHASTYLSPKLFLSSRELDTGRKHWMGLVILPSAG